jgi:hypothetical protein
MRAEREQDDQPASEAAFVNGLRVTIPTTVIQAFSDADLSELSYFVFDAYRDKVREILTRNGKTYEQP